MRNILIFAAVAASLLLSACATRSSENQATDTCAVRTVVGPPGKIFNGHPGVVRTKDCTADEAATQK